MTKGREPQLLDLRLAFRHEGEFVNCYIAAPGTMLEALLLGSLLYQLVRVGPVWDQYKSLMASALAEVCKQQLGVEVTDFYEMRAPERER